MSKKKAIQWNYELVKAFVEGDDGNGCRLLSEEYKNMKTKMLFMCKCENEFITDLTTFKSKNKRSCDKCSGNYRISPDEAKDIFISRGFIPLFSEDDYKNKQSKLSAETKHGYKIYTTLSNFDNKNPIIFGRDNPYTIENIKVYLENSKSLYKLLSTQFVHSRENLTFECNEHGEFYISWNDISNNHGCPKCDNNQRLSLKEIKSRLKIINPNIEILSKKYINNRGQLECKCLADNHIWSTSWSNLSRGCGCPKCAGNIKLTLDDIRSKLIEINSDIEILDNNYVNSKVPLKCKCKIDSHVWYPIWDSLQSGNGCPVCAIKMNSGEFHHSYNPNLTEEERRLGRNYIGDESYSKWRKEVYEKDNYSCQTCNQRGYKIVAHHLDGWNWCVEKRVDVNNGVTLCENCHNDFHGEYGRGNNTKEQFQKWMNLIKS